eukprot:SAG11_NODE_570_length_8454_cov_19.886655_9_plen_165_part_00
MAAAGDPLAAELQVPDGPIAGSSWANVRGGGASGGDGWANVQGGGASSGDGWANVQGGGASSGDGWANVQGGGASSGDGWANVQGGGAHACDDSRMYGGGSFSNDVREGQFGPRASVGLSRAPSSLVEVPIVPVRATPDSFLDAWAHCGASSSGIWLSGGWKEL